MTNKNSELNDKHSFKDETDTLKKNNDEPEESPRKDDENT